jgi:hypothetical protein
MKIKNSYFIFMLLFYSFSFSKGVYLIKIDLGGQTGSRKLINF